LLERALEASGDDLDSAIKSLTELRLESAEAILSATVGESENGLSAALKLSAEGTVSNGHLGVVTEHPPATDNDQTNNQSSEWVELFVREMMSSSDIDDARARASRALEAFEKSIMDRVGAEAVHNLHRENAMLKEQLSIILRENAVLKRGVAIQHERQKEFDVRTQEADSLKQLVLQYQEQLKTLEVLPVITSSNFDHSVQKVKSGNRGSLQINNYALRVHLKQAQQNNSMPGRFPPDVF
jgi:hypothetical protein